MLFLHVENFRNLHVHVFIGFVVVYSCVEGKGQTKFSGCLCAIFFLLACCTTGAQIWGKSKGGFPSANEARGKEQGEGLAFSRCASLVPIGCAFMLPLFATPPFAPKTKNLCHKHTTGAHHSTHESRSKGWSKGLEQGVGKGLALLFRA